MDNGGAGGSQRDPAFDVLRAVALVSMVSLHISRSWGDSSISRVLHSAHWIDGAFVFVALSGLVAGLVHRRMVDQRGVRASVVKLCRRAGFLYLVHVGLALGIIVVRTIHEGSLITDTPRWSLDAVLQVLILRIEPNWSGILSMYVLFLPWAAVVVWLLAQGKAALVVAASVAAYAAGHIVDVLAVESSGFHVLSWQLLFTGGLLVGWSWQRERLQLSAATRRGVAAGSVVVFAVLFVLARWQRTIFDAAPWALTDKMSGGLVTFVFAATAMVTGYVLIAQLRKVNGADAAMAPVALAGSKGLPGYVAMVVCVLVIQVAPVLYVGDPTVVVAIVICGASEYAALRLDRRRRAAAGPAVGPPAPLLPVMPPEPLVPLTSAEPLAPLMPPVVAPSTSP